jgi:flagellar basal body rod protein FlgB
VKPVVYEPRDTMEQIDGNDVSMNREVAEVAKNATMYDAYIQMARGKIKLMNLAASTVTGG